jgi:small neutral amino acid transporter SnatA (MarC family)
MTLQDVFVGAVAVGIGLFALLSAAFNWDWSYQFWTARWVESRFGRRGARVFYVILGLVMIALGVAIATGFGPNDSRRETNVPEPSQSWRQV